MEKRRRKELNMQEKVSLINDSRGLSQRKLAERYGIGKTQVQTILKRKAEFLEGYEQNMDSSRKRLCKRSPLEELNGLMWSWFQKARSQGLPLSGPMLQEKALLYAVQLGIQESEFKASNGWLNRFRERHNINFASLCGESGSVCQETVDDWTRKLPDIVSGYKPCDIYNMDETGLFYCALPDKTLSIRGEECKGGKKSKERLTVALCVNMEGDFEKPLVIGKSANPQCFKNIRHLPVLWKFNKKAWMTGALFTDWIKDLDRKMRTLSRHIVLLLDNAPSHPRDLKLTNIRVVFLPANTTSKLQPLDQGIIQNLKQVYRKRLLRSVLTKIGDGETVNASEISRSVSVLDAVQWISLSVKDIKRSTVEKCFKRCGFQSPVETDACSDDETDDIPLQELINLMRAAKSRLCIEEEMSPEQYADLDCDTPVCADLNENWENELIETISNHASTTSSDGEDEEPEVAEELGIRNYQEAVKHLEQLKLFFQTKDMEIAHLQDAEYLLQTNALKLQCAGKQTTLDRFFRK